MSGMLKFLLLGAVGLAVILLAIRSDGLAAGNLGAEDYASLIGLSILGLLVGSSVLGHFRGRMGEAVQAILGWVGIVAILAVVYTYRFEFEAVGRRVLANVGASTNEGVTGSREVTIGRDPGGTYTARVAVNGARAVPMIVDTGASTVVLNDQDARRAGIKVDELSFTVPIQTANGQALAAVVMLDTIAVGPIAETRVRAMVTRPGALSISLLGHTFLDRLASYEVSGRRMVLRGK